MAAALAAGTLVGCGCGAASAAQGEWARIDPETSSPLGDVLTIEGKTWKMTGFPAMSGRIESKDGNIQLIIEKVDAKTREEAIKTPGAVNVEKTLKNLDSQLVFEVVEEGGKSTLKQVGKSRDFAEWRFERRP